MRTAPATPHVTVRRRGAARPTRTGAALLTAALLLAGCTGGDDGEATPAPTAEASARPTASPTPSATPTPTAAPTETAAAPSAAPVPGAQPGTGSVTNGENAITSPAPGADLAGPDVVVQGEGTGLEGTLEYRVLVAGTQDVVAEGFTDAGVEGDVAPFAIDLALEPGDYIVQVWEPDVSGDPAAPMGDVVEVSFTVG